MNSFRIAKEAYETLQEGTEQCMTSIFTKANRLAIRTKRQVMYISDLNEAIAKPNEHHAPQQVCRFAKITITKIRTPRICN